MIQPHTAAQSAKISLPAIAAVYVSASQAYVLSAEGEIKTLPHAQARMILHKKPVMVCHAPYTRGKLGLEEFQAFDVLELFAFVHPTTFCVPTPHGLCAALGIKPGAQAEDQPFALLDIAGALLGDLRRDPLKAKADPVAIAGVMGLQGKGWAWTPYVFSALGETYNPQEPVMSRKALNVWQHLPEWAEDAPEPPPSHHGVTAAEARERLETLLGADAEKRTQQFEYAEALIPAFEPVREAENPNIVVAEAGTGIGKTLGYIAPASVWAEKNAGTVWISTYTKNLQRQIDQELNRLYPDPTLKDTHVAIRKGRENYLCLLNLEETSSGAGLARHPDQAIAAGIMARWAAATRDGDLTGADYPGWLTGLLGHAWTGGMADRRGECIYAACDHYHKCFIERSVRKSKRARIVIANHALVMIQAALSIPGEDLPDRYVFDEGHHLFDAADSAFAAHLTAQETRDLRRWLLGAEGGKQTRARGLKRRAEDLAEGHAEAEKAVADILYEAACLTGEGWAQRLKRGEPSGPAEHFLALVYKQVFARADGRDGPYSLETQTYPLDPEIAAKAKALAAALKKLQKPMLDLVKIFRRKLAEDQGALSADTRKRLDAVSASIERRAVLMVGAWVRMLEDLCCHPERSEGSQNREGDPSAAGLRMTSEVTWLEIERIDSRAIDVGMYRHLIDPMRAFAMSLRPHLQGMAVTSATLRDQSGESGEGWDAAFRNTGAASLSAAPIGVSIPSPFDYPAQTKVFIINDVRKDDLSQVGGAYRALFEASGGGGLGLFTAIQRLRAVHGRIAGALEDSGIPLYAQHVDEIDTGTLVDMFRDDTHACLLGTDAVRDGVDVPGDSLRLIVFDRVPWPRPTILHKARREMFGKKEYDERVTRMKLKQAFGRLIRRADDKGVFVMLDPMFPSRLHNAFPADVEIRKCGLAEAVEGIKGFFK